MVEFERDDLVLLIIYDTIDGSKTPKKLTRPWHGPYRIIEKLSPLVYRLTPAADGVDSNLIKAPINITRLRRYNTLPTEFRNRTGAIFVPDDELEPEFVVDDELIGSTSTPGAVGSPSSSD